MISFSFSFSSLFGFIFAIFYLYEWNFVVVLKMKKEQFAESRARCNTQTHTINNITKNALSGRGLVNERERESVHDITRPWLDYRMENVYLSYTALSHCIFRLSILFSVWMYVSFFLKMTSEIWERLESCSHNHSTQKEWEREKYEIKFAINEWWNFSANHFFILIGNWKIDRGRGRKREGGRERVCVCV